MGASGNLSLIDLNQYSFEQIKEKLLENILEGCPEYSSDSELEDTYFKVAKFKDIKDFISYFRTKVADYCPDKNGIAIGKTFYGNWAGDELPCIIDNHLVLYDTDQQMYYQNIPTDYLRDLICDHTEIWT